jgi:hypothetical protein
VLVAELVLPGGLSDAVWLVVAVYKGQVSLVQWGLFNPVQKSRMGQADVHDDRQWQVISEQ